MDQQEKTTSGGASDTDPVARDGSLVGPEASGHPENEQLPPGAGSGGPFGPPQEPGTDHDATVIVIPATGSTISRKRNAFMAPTASHASRSGTARIQCTAVPGRPTEVHSRGEYTHRTRRSTATFSNSNFCSSVVDDEFAFSPVTDTQPHTARLSRSPIPSESGVSESARSTKGQKKKVDWSFSRPDTFHRDDVVKLRLKQLEENRRRREEEDRAARASAASGRSPTTLSFTSASPRARTDATANHPARSTTTQLSHGDRASVCTVTTTATTTTRARRLHTAEPQDEETERYQRTARLIASRNTRGVLTHESLARHERAMGLPDPQLEFDSNGAHDPVPSSLVYEFEQASKHHPHSSFASQRPDTGTPPHKRQSPLSPDPSPQQPPSPMPHDPSYPSDSHDIDSDGETQLINNFYITQIAVSTNGKTPHTAHSRNPANPTSQTHSNVDQTPTTAETERTFTAEVSTQQATEPTPEPDNTQTPTAPILKKTQSAGPTSVHEPPLQKHKTKYTTPSPAFPNQTANTHAAVINSLSPTITNLKNDPQHRTPSGSTTMQQQTIPPTAVAEAERDELRDMYVAARQERQLLVEVGGVEAAESEARRGLVELESVARRECLLALQDMREIVDIVRFMWLCESDERAQIDDFEVRSRSFLSAQAADAVSQLVSADGGSGHGVSMLGALAKGDDAADGPHDGLSEGKVLLRLAEFSASADEAMPECVVGGAAAGPPVTGMGSWAVSKPSDSVSEPSGVTFGALSAAPPPRVADDGGVHEVSHPSLGTSGSGVYNRSCRSRYVAAADGRGVDHLELRCTPRKKRGGSSAAHGTPIGPRCSQRSSIAVSDAEDGAWRERQEQAGDATVVHILNEAPDAREEAVVDARARKSAAFFPRTDRCCTSQLTLWEWLMLPITCCRPVDDEPHAELQPINEERDEDPGIAGLLPAPRASPPLPAIAAWASPARSTTVAPRPDSDGGKRATPPVVRRPPVAIADTHHCSPAPPAPVGHPIASHPSGKGGVAPGPREGVEDIEMSAMPKMD